MTVTTVPMTLKFYMYTTSKLWMLDDVGSPVIEMFEKSPF